SLSFPTRRSSDLGYLDPVMRAVGKQPRPGNTIKSCRVNPPAFPCILSVYSRHIPFVPSIAGYNRLLTGEALYKPHIIPGHRQVAEEVAYGLRYGCHPFRRFGI